MARFYRSFDYDLIRHILTDEKIFPHITDDNSPAREDYRPPEGDHVWYVLVKDGAEILGLFILLPQNSICWEMHIAMLPSSWGDRALDACREFFPWVWEHTPCQRIVMHVPSSNRLALHYAVRAGMKIYGTNHLSFLKNGILRDQVCFGLSKSDHQYSDQQRFEAIEKLRQEIEGGVECHGRP